MKALAGLVGLLHDMGKATAAYQKYLYYVAEHWFDASQRGSVHHSPIGAIFAYEKWYTSGDSIQQITAQIISMSIRGHHGGLLDCVNINGRSIYLDSIQRDKRELFYYEAVCNFLSQVTSENELNRLYADACREAKTLLLRVQKDDRPFTQGMLTRMLLSFVVDADRWDTACFERDEDPFVKEELADWSDLLARLEKTLLSYDHSSDIGKIRKQISEECARGAEKTPGIYTITVPTGGGKTLSSLRFALAHAKRYGKGRIFYIIPYNTILEQNSADIRDALSGYTGILEHYGTYFSEAEGDDGWEEEKLHLLLTERWNMPIIMTSMVQFLNSLFRCENSNARRMSRLAGSILIFDEIQALPKYCTRLFEKAVSFLADCLGCTVLLCTATQPSLNLTTQELLPKKLPRELFQSLKRTQLIDESDIPRNNDCAAKDIAELFELHGSVLVVVNTKRVAADLFNQLQKMPLSAQYIHLSTSMCPAHRLDQIRVMKKLLDSKTGQKPVICISTMLIEAGVNISFPCVVRSLAGLPSVMQVDGRCNRNMELKQTLGMVYLWRFMEENLGPLEEIRKGQQCTDAVKEMMNTAGTVEALNTLTAMVAYFQMEKGFYSESDLQYPWDKQKTSNHILTDMLEYNKRFRQHSDFESKHSSRYKQLRLFQAFATAGKAFEVIQQDTVSVLVPYEKGGEYIAALCAEQTLPERIRTLRLAQSYAISVQRQVFQRLSRENAIYPLGETGVFALHEWYYHRDLGLRVEPGEMEFMNP
jgi:CRISPR-associated endonuclease/helicase Cas3